MVWDESGYGYGYDDGAGCALDDWYGPDFPGFPGRGRLVAVERTQATRTVTRDGSSGATIATAIGDGPSLASSGNASSPIAAPPPPAPISSAAPHSSPPPPRFEPHP